MVPTYSQPRAFLLVSSGLLQYVLLFALLSFPAQTLTQSPNATRNMTIPLDLPQIVYTPSLCDRNTPLSGPAGCNGGWVIRQEGGPRTVSTTGPNQATGEIIPQMFFQFRASALYLFTSPTSNAQANITITTNGTTISATFDSSLGSASILNLVQPSISTFALTFLPNDTPRELVLTSMIITIPNATVVSTIPTLPTMTLPPSSPPPIFTPASISSTATRTSPANPSSSANQPFSGTSSARRSNIAIAVGVTVGLGLGLTSIAALGFLWYRWRRRKRKWAKSMAADQNAGPRASTRLVTSRGTSRADSRGAGNIGTGNVGMVGSERSAPVTPGWRDSLA